MTKKTTGITRRMVLAGTAAVGMGAGVVVSMKATQWWARPPGKGLKALSREEHDVVQAIGEAWMPQGHGPPSLSGAEAQVGAFVDEVVARMAPMQAKLFKMMLHIIDETTLPLEFARYTDLDVVKRAEHLQVWLDSPLYLHRQGVGAVMALVSMGYTSHPEVAPVFAVWFGCGYGQ